jgi:hypothetical protein
VRRGRSYRYRLVMLAGTGRSLPSKAITVRRAAALAIRVTNAGDVPPAARPAVTRQ